jgi:hypothetical protein
VYIEWNLVYIILNDDEHGDLVMKKYVIYHPISQQFVGSFFNVADPIHALMSGSQKEAQDFIDFNYGHDKKSYQVMVISYTVMEV